MHTPPDPAYKPLLRVDLSAKRDGDGVQLFDPRHVGGGVGLSAAAFEVVRLFDGTRTLKDVQAAVAKMSGGSLVPLDTLSNLVAGLDEAVLLDGPRFRALFAGPVRPPSCVGCYDGDPARLRAQVRELFTAPGGAGLPSPLAGEGRGEARGVRGETSTPGTPPPVGESPTPHPQPLSRKGRGEQDALRAVLVPHMDYGRGNVTYGWGFKELAERTAARLFVIVATSHHGFERFTLTRQHFQTPLGVAETDQEFVSKLVTHYGPRGGGDWSGPPADADSPLFDDPVAHVPEHSIELEVVPLQYLFADRGPIKIVPLLVGSMHDCVEQGVTPDAADDVARMIRALRRAEAETAEPVCYVISGDLAHIGPYFDDPDPVSDGQLAHSKNQDDQLLAKLAAADHDGFFRVAAAERNERRICGLSPAYVALAAARPRSGAVLHYQQFVAPDRSQSVSFAAAAFYG